MALELVRSRTAPTAIDAVATHRRRLMAVMLADVVGYSRMMSRSEDETHARFTRHARELIEPTIDKYHGRLVRSMGDGLLVEFSGAIDAVRCATLLNELSVRPSFTETLRMRLNDVRCSAAG